MDGEPARPIHAGHRQRQALYHGLRRRRPGFAGSDHLSGRRNRQTALATWLQRFPQRHDLSSLRHLEPDHRPRNRQCLYAGHAGDSRGVHPGRQKTLGLIDDGSLRAADVPQRPHGLAAHRQGPCHHARHHRQLGRARSGRRPLLRVRQENGRTGLGFFARRPTARQFLLPPGAGLARWPARVLRFDRRRQRCLRERAHGRRALAHPAFQGGHQLIRPRPQQRQNHRDLRHAL